MQINSYFSDFLQGIRLTPSQRQDLIKGHTTLKNRLLADENLKSFIINTFLQGSYRRSTAVRPLNDKRADVDIIVVTNLNKDKYSPDEAIAKFIPFVEKHYKGKYRIQGRSIGIELSYVDLDIVITSAPSEADVDMLKSQSVSTNIILEDISPNYEWRLIKGWLEPDLQKGIATLNESQRKEVEWKLQPLLIPDREAKKWVETNPLEQIRWTRDKNGKTSGHYINVVKALKWWRTLKLTDIKYPKGYPIEHMIGDCCPDDISSVAEGVVLTLEAIVNNYKTNRLLERTPVLPDRGVESHNVWQRVSGEDFVKFYDQVKDYAKIAREAYNAEKLKDQVTKWKELFGDKFPNAPEDDGSDNGDKGSSVKSNGFTKREEITVPQYGRFA